MSAKNIWLLLKESGSKWNSDLAPSLAAALAFYTVFSLAPLLIIASRIASIAFNAQMTDQAVERQMESLFGRTGAEATQSIVQHSHFFAGRAGFWTTLAGCLALFIGATAVFGELQSSLNIIWRVEAKKLEGFRIFLKQRALSFLMVVLIGFLLLISLVISTGLAVITKYFSSNFPKLGLTWELANFGLSLGVTAILFALIYKILPDAKIKWSEVVWGSLITALLFTLGKTAIGFYLGRSSVASSYGVAGALAVLLLWIYYSAQIFFFGAELIYVHQQKILKEETGSPPIPALS